MVVDIILHLISSSFSPLSQTFDGNTMFNTSKTNKLTPNVVAKQLRLVPLEFKSGRRKHICLRMEVYGCSIDDQIGTL